MNDSPPRIAALQQQVSRLVQPRAEADAGRIELGLDTIDARIGGGMVRGRLHEVVAADAADAAVGAGFVAMLARRIANNNKGALVWLRVGDVGSDLYPPGLNEIGIDPAQVLLVVTRDSADLLRAAGEVARCAAVAMAVIELWREPKRIDLTVSRRLALAAERSGVTPLLLRIAADPVPSAAQTRWGVSAAPSTPLAADAPGAPALNLELLRQRGGPAGWRWRVEWNRDAGKFSGREFMGSQFRLGTAPLPGDLAALSDSGSPLCDAVGDRIAVTG